MSDEAAPTFSIYGVPKYGETCTVWCNICAKSWMLNPEYVEAFKLEHVERYHAKPAPTIYEEIAAERARAHAKHGPTSMESYAPDDLLRFTILVEEVGEVGKEFNEAAGGKGYVDMEALRKELVQVAAMAAAWADVIA